MDKAFLRMPFMVSLSAHCGNSNLQAVYYALNRGVIRIHVKSLYSLSTWRYRLPHGRVERRPQRYQYQADREQRNRPESPHRLQQVARQHVAQRNQAVDNHPVSAIDSPLQGIRDLRSPVAYLHHVVDFIDQPEAGQDDPNDKRRGSQSVQRPDQCESTESPNDDLSETKAPLYQCPQQRADYAANPANAKNQTDRQGRGSLMLCQHNNDQPHAIIDKNQPTHEQCDRANHRVTPQPGHASRNLYVQLAGSGGTYLL